MTWRYVDHQGRRRIKRRYAWALQAYGAGLLSGLLLAALL